MHGQIHQCKIIENLEIDQKTFENLLYDKDRVTNQWGGSIKTRLFHKC